MKTKGLTQEQLLTIWLDTEPTEISPYKMDDYPAMWKTKELKDGTVLFTKPGKTMERPYSYAPYESVDGIHYQFRKDGKWLGQGCQTTFKYFEKNGASLIN